jgi:hypothetical protein
MHRIRHFLPSRGTIIALLVMLLVTAGSATAGSLITSGQIANRTIRTVDLHPSLSDKLNDWFAKVDGNGRLVAGRHVISTSRVAPGDFRVTFNRPVDRCAAVASVRGTNELQFHGFITTYTPSGRTVRVVVRDPQGNPADGAGFNLISSC